MTDLVEIVAFAMWKAEADRAAPNVGKHRTLEGFASASPAERDRWLGLAEVAVMHALSEAAVAEERARHVGIVARLEAKIRYYERRENWRARETN